VMRLVLASIAFMFVMVQNARLTRAHEAAPGGRPPAQARARSRQRRGGRKQ